MCGPSAVSKAASLEIIAVSPSARRRSGIGIPFDGTIAHLGAWSYILYRMVKYRQARLDASFAALSDATRRGVLEQLGRSDATITDLARQFHITLAGMMKHVGVLEQAGLVTTEKVGRVRSCRLGAHRLKEETAWLEGYRQRWDERFDELDKVVEELTRKEKSDERRNRR